MLTTYSDSSLDLQPSRDLFSLRHPSSHTPTTHDLTLLKQLAFFVTSRSSALVAVCVYTFWRLRISSQYDYITTLPQASPERAAAEADDLLETTVAFNGSVIESYPGYSKSCQLYLDDLTAEYGKEGDEKRTIKLVPAKESSLMGAAVALASLRDE